MIEIIPNWHPIFVHFTVALFSIATLFYVLSQVVSDKKLQTQWYTVAKWNLWVGALISVLTVIAGWQAYNTVDHDTPSHLAMTDHRNWAMVTFIFFLLLAGWSYVLDKSGRNKNWLFVGLMVIASGVLASTAWRGGEVVYRYGLGVMSLPQVEGEGHAHEHADGQGHGDTVPRDATADKSKTDEQHASPGMQGHHDSLDVPDHHDAEGKPQKPDSHHHDDGKDHAH